MTGATNADSRIRLPGGAELAVRRISRPEGRHRPILVFLHEALGCITTWRDFPDRLSKACGCSAMVYDRLGHGQSDRLTPQMQTPAYIDKEALEFLPAVLDACNIRNSVLIGHSDGGTIALLYAASHPETIKAIVTEAAHVFVDPLTIEGINQTVRAYASGHLKSRLARHHQENLGPLFRRWATIWRSTEFAGWNITDRIRGVCCPVLVLQGGSDEYGTLDQVEAICAHVSGPARQQIIPDCGHIPHHQARQPVIVAMSQFIRQCLKAKS